MHLGPIEVGLILIIVLVIFGPGKLPEVGAALGRGIREFRKGASEDPDAPEAENESHRLPNQVASDFKGSDADERGKAIEYQQEQKGESYADRQRDRQ